MNHVSAPPHDRTQLPDAGHRRLLLGTERANIVVGLRSAAVAAIATVATMSLLLLALTLGDFPLDIAQVIAAFGDTSNSLARTVVVDWRLPRAGAAMVFGAALAIAGAIFQTLMRNPLASPDVLGLANGSFSGMLIALLMFDGSWPLLMAGSLVGGVGAAVLIYLLALRGGLQGFRFIVVGIGISAMLASLNTWMLLRAELETALFASAWGAGTLNSVTASTSVPAAICVLALLALVPLIAPALHQLGLGDDAAAATGVSLGRVRLGGIAIAVALVSVVTAVAGPIAFIALAAPQITRRLASTPGIPFMTTGVVGAVLLLGSDLIAQHLVPVTVPVGVVTVVLGGGYLVWLLMRETNRTRT